MSTWMREQNLANGLNMGVYLDIVEQAAVPKTIERIEEDAEDIMQRKAAAKYEVGHTPYNFDKHTDSSSHFQYRVGSEILLDDWRSIQLRDVDLGYRVHWRERIAVALILRMSKEKTEQRPYISTLSGFILGGEKGLVQIRGTNERIEDTCTSLASESGYQVSTPKTLKQIGDLLHWYDSSTPDNNERVEKPGFKKY